MPKQPKKRKAAPNPTKRVYSRTIEDNIGHMRLNLEACVPGLLNTDPIFRRIIISFLCHEYSGEVKKAVRNAA